MRISSLKHLVLFPVCCLITFLFLATHAAFGDTESAHPNIVLLTQLGQSEYVAGEAVRLNVIIKNEGKTTIPLGGSAFDVSSFRITVQDDQGQTTPLTHYGKYVLTPPFAVFRNISVQVPAGQQRRYQFNLSRMFDLSRKGNYRVSVTRSIVTGYKKGADNVLYSQTMELIAAPVKIRIVENPALRSGIEPVSPAPSKRQYLYLVNSQSRFDSTHGSVTRYQINVDGTVSPTLGSSVLAGKGSSAITIGHDGKFAYILNGGDDSISQFHIGANGVLTPLLQPTVPTEKYPQSLVIDPTGQWVYAASTRGARAFHVGKNGELTPLSDKLPHFRPVANMVFSPDGQFLYAGNASVTQSKVDADGSLTVLSPGYVVADNPRTIAMDASGRYLYVLTNHDLPVNKGKPHQSEQVITPFKIAKNGSLSPLRKSVSPRDAGISTCCLSALYVHGHYLYAVNENQGDMLQYEIGDKGKLTFKSSNFPKPIGWCVALVFDDSNHFAYGANRYSTSIATYKVDKQGGLTPFGINANDEGGEMGGVAIVQAPVAAPQPALQNGIQMVARMERDVYNPDVPVILTLTLKNAGHQPLPFDSSLADMTHFDITIKNDDGKTMPLLSRGKELLKLATETNSSHQLAASKQIQFQFVLNRLYDITSAGTYTVTVQRRVKDANILHANPLRFKIDNPYDNLTGTYLNSLPDSYHYANGFGFPLSPK